MAYSYLQASSPIHLNAAPSLLIFHGYAAELRARSHYGEESFTLLTKFW
ncbi:hypothetical protein MEG1DRAFT_01358 [Photorhabdus temperata subsp. temperata Meg1]|uniref:Uncharacterized protein n=1 Tax=Photorhabdus temperata subsp. temperata Meg1 TaxID=1393735 RepID=A0A081RZ41_PHOTE|nr:hypothetical protein MEG1DRAFT_01358 [Photorhabdus temperata subsp. temperata Meg1]